MNYSKIVAGAYNRTFDRQENTDVDEFLELQVSIDKVLNI